MAYTNFLEGSDPICDLSDNLLNHFRNWESAVTEEGFVNPRDLDISSSSTLVFPDETYFGSQFPVDNGISTSINDNTHNELEKCDPAIGLDVEPSCLTVSNGNPMPSTISSGGRSSRFESRERQPKHTSPEKPNMFGPGFPRRKSRYSIQRSSGRVNPIFIPPKSNDLDPLQRWQESPPEDEPTSLSAIKDAVQSLWSERADGNALIDSGQCLENQDAFRTYRRPPSQAASTTSAESTPSASSQQSSNTEISSGSHSSRSKKPKHRVHKAQSGGKKRRSTATTDTRPFCCTFCCDRFKTKYDWMRHEKSLHLNLENWICAPFGGTVVLPSTGRVHCAYCNMLDPTPTHLEQHNHGACHGPQRMFRRKDHLVQHLRHVHYLETIPLINDWKVESANFTSRCGFCGCQMSSWSERGDHLAGHFRNGLTMADWKGDHDFPDWVSKQVTHAVPPYLVDLESRTLIPFSATNNQVQDHFSQMLSRASFRDDDVNTTSQGVEPNLLPTLDEYQGQESQVHSYTQVLALQLSHFANEKMRLGIAPTDEMLQREGRRLLFDTDDPWNQTAADHPEWLAAFRETFCIPSPSDAGHSTGIAEG